MEETTVAGIRITGMASGLPPNIVEQLMEAERIPIKNMEVQKKKVDDKLKLVSELETKISDIKKNMDSLTNIKGFADKVLNSGFPDIISGTADANVADTGDWTIEVLQLAEKPTAQSTGFPDKDKTRLGTGYIKFETENGVKEIYINQDNSTLEKVAAQINQSGNGLSAIVVTDKKDKDNPYKLQVSGLKSGDENQVSFPIIYLLDGDEDFSFEKTKPAVNAKFKLDGMEYESSSNTISDLIPGVALDLKKAAAGTPVKINITENHEAISTKVKSFVDAYNGALAFIQNQNKLTGDSKNQRLGPLGGDGMLRTIETKLRNLILDPRYGTGSNVMRLNEIGIEFNRSGTLNLNQDKFNAKVKADPQAVAKFLRGDGFSVGFMPTVKNGIDSLLNGQFGAVGTRKKNYSDRINQMNERIEDKERQLVKKEDSLRRKFSDLESRMSQLQSQGAGVANIGKT